MIESQFETALHAAGLGTKEPIIADGQIHRFRVEGDKPYTKNGWYVLYLGEIPAGAFGSWKNGVSSTWCARDFKTLSKRDKRSFQIRMKQAETQRKAEQEKRHYKAQIKAQDIWHEADACLSHPYLTRKYIKPYGVREYRGKLVIPLYDMRGTICSLQFIDGDGNKRFLSGGRKKGRYFPIEGAGESLLICEGFATGATLRMIHGLATAVAFDAGNLMPVAKALRAKYPARDITICADNDANGGTNTGVDKATEAARTIGAKLIIPPISGDFNDYYVEGLKT